MEGRVLVAGGERAASSAIASFLSLSTCEEAANAKSSPALTKLPSALNDRPRSSKYSTSGLPHPDRYLSPNFYTGEGDGHGTHANSTVLSHGAYLAVAGGTFNGHDINGIGFDKVELGGDKSLDSHAYAHYLHHKYFEVNYGDGLIPFDKWFGTFHDGSAQGDARMKARYAEKKARMNAKAEAAKSGRAATPGE